MPSVRGIRNVHEGHLGKELWARAASPAMGDLPSSIQGFPYPTDGGGEYPAYRENGRQVFFGCRAGCGLRFEALAGPHLAKGLLRVPAAICQRRRGVSSSERSERPGAAMP